MIKLLKGLTKEFGLLMMPLLILTSGLALANNEIKNKDAFFCIKVQYFDSPLYWVSVEKLTGLKDVPGSAVNGDTASPEEINNHCKYTPIEELESHKKE